MMMRVPDQGRESPLDLRHDPERHTQRHPPLFAGHNYRALPLERGSETLQLEFQWLAVRCVELDAIHECRDVGWRRTNCRRIDIGAEAEVFSCSGAQVERQISALLKDPDLTLSLSRNPAGRERKSTRLN